MGKVKDINKYLETMQEANETPDCMRLVDLAVKYANLVQMAYRLEMELKEAVGYGILEDEPKHAVTMDVLDDAQAIAAFIIRNHLGQFELDTATENGLEDEP